MIDIIHNLIPKVIDTLDNSELWDSIQLKKKPWRQRAWQQFGEYRICLHSFQKCSSEDVNFHVHAWPAAFLVLSGSYIHTIATSPTDAIYREIVRPYTIYEMDNQRVWHHVQPIEDTYTIMCHGRSWGEVKQKDFGLEKIEPNELARVLQKFRGLLTTYQQLFLGCN